MIKAYMVSVALGLALAGTAAAQDEAASPMEGTQKEEAKAHFMKAKTLVEQGALEEAISDFEQSYTLNPLPIVIYNIAVCLDELGRNTEAMDRYLEYLEAAGKDVPPDKKAEVEARIAKLMELVPAPVETPADAAPPAGPEAGHGPAKIEPPATEQPVVPIEVQSEAVTVEAAGKEASGNGGKKDKPVKKLGKAPFAVAAAVSIAALSTATITGALALSTHEEFQSKYYEDRDDWKPLKDRSDSLAIATDVLIGMGCAAAVAAVVLGVLTEWKGAEEKKAQAGGEVSQAEGSSVLASPLVLPGGTGLVLHGTF